MIRLEGLKVLKSQLVELALCLMFRLMMLNYLLKVYFIDKIKSLAILFLSISFSFKNISCLLLVIFTFQQ